MIVEEDIIYYFFCKEDVDAGCWRWD